MKESMGKAFRGDTGAVPQERQMDFSFAAIALGKKDFQTAC